MKVKEWFYNKMEDTSSKYNTFIDAERNEDGTINNDKGFVTVIVEEIIKESEKAINVRLSTGNVLGSAKGWEVWVPKSVILK